jgi:hypothetical protein
MKRTRKKRTPTLHLPASSPLRGETSQQATGRENVRGLKYHVV